MAQARSSFSFLSWIAVRLMFSGGRFFSRSSWLALTGLVLGVASLFVSMAVFSGFEATLKKNIVDFTGHVQLKKKSTHSDDPKALFDKIKKINPEIVAATRFARVDGIMASKGRVQGVELQGLDPAETEKVLDLKSRVAKGHFEFSEGSASIGKGLAKRLNLDVGDEFRIVVPVADELNPQNFKRQVGKFKVVSILDLGKFEYDERVVITDLASAQKLSGIGDNYSGLLIRLSEAELAPAVASNLTEKLGVPYWVSDWRELSGNLFEAVKMERVIIFFVVLIIVIAAAFNVASTLFVSVVQRYSDIAILKALGLDQKSLVRVFSVQGVMLGAIGLLAGILLGSLFCVGFVFIQNHFGVLPGSVYKIDRIELSIRVVDVVAIVAATLVICFVATLAPSRRGAKLNPIEGLRYE